MSEKKRKHCSIFGNTPVKALWLLAAALWIIFFAGELALQLVRRYPG